AAQAAVMLVSYIVLSFLTNYQFAILVAVGAGLSNFLYKRIYVATKKASIGVSEQGSEFNSLLTQAVHNYKYLKSTNYFDRFSKKLIEVINKIEILNRKMGLYSAITSSAREPMIIMVVSLVIYIQINYMGASLASILFCLLLFFRALNYLVVVQNFWQTFIQNIGSMHLVSTLHAELEEVKEEQKSKVFETLRSEISLSNINFAYGPKVILNNLSLTIPKNQTVAFIGESGSGKTTLANMICSLIEPASGELLVDGVKLNDYNLDSYRDKIGYISQEAVIFNDNIYNNITFWDEPTEENLKRFWDIVSLASLTDFISAQPQQHLTELGDNGILVSGGQKQRISIARELYKKVEILILDEATSALDSETEKIIQENIERLHGSYTMIIIAHRLSTIKEADRIYLLDKGETGGKGAADQMLIADRDIE
ncbi:MAG: ABC transporter ATP-binding protein, partial [Pedobacter sp.]